MPVIALETFIHAPVAVVFDLCRNIDFHVRTQTAQKERAVSGVTSGLITLGQSVTWEAVHFGVRQRLTSKITQYDPPACFVDEMVRGAFKSFRHTHIFRPSGDGTLMRDLFDYQSPYGVLGVIADTLFLEKYMRDLLRARNTIIKHEAERSV